MSFVQILILRHSLGNPRGSQTQFQYLDLKQTRDSEFGSKTPIRIEDKMTRSFTVIVTEVAFTDNSVWKAPADAEWQKLPAKRPIAEALANSDLAEEYKIAVGSPALYAPELLKDLWGCTCGAVNHEAEETCHHCCKKYQEQVLALNADSLQAAFEKHRAEKDALEKKRAEEKEIRCKHRKKTNKIISALAIFALAATSIFLFVTRVVLPQREYDAAAELEKSGNYIEARAAFEQLGKFKDSSVRVVEIDNQVQYMAADKLEKEGSIEAAEKAFDLLRNFSDAATRASDLKEQISYEKAETLLEQGEKAAAADAYEAAGDYEDAAEKARSLRQEMIDRENAIQLAWNNIVADPSISSMNTTVAVSVVAMAAIQEDGGILATQDTSKWNSIKNVHCGFGYIIGVKTDGTVLAAGDNDEGQGNVEAWQEIVTAACGTAHTVGLRRDGTVVATGRNDYGQCEVSDWHNIKDIAAGMNYTLGLQEDGKVILAGEGCYPWDTSRWPAVTAISGGDLHAVGITRWGSVVATGGKQLGQCDVEFWKNIVAVSAGTFHTVGLRNDGTVVATGDNRCGQCDVSLWKNIVEVAAGSYSTVGLKKDGTIVTTGDIGKTITESKWTDVKIPAPNEEEMQ